MPRYFSKIKSLVKEEGVSSTGRYLLIQLIVGAASFLLHPLKRKPKDEPFYGVFDRFISHTNSMDRPNVLEIGSRNVGGIVRRGLFSPSVSYTGFDILEGENVDVVGDAHALSATLAANSYDAAFSVSVFEHLAMPWKAVLEINRILKPGGLLYVSTHPAWAPHELPWDFWRFSGESFKALFNERTGFEIIECVEGNPAVIVSLSCDPSTRLSYRAPVSQSVAVIARKTGDPAPDLQWNVTATDILNSMYPKT